MLIYDFKVSECFNVWVRECIFVCVCENFYDVSTFSLEFPFYSKQLYGLYNDNDDDEY